MHQNANAAMVALARALAPALAQELAPLLGITVGQRYVHEHDEYLLERTGVTPRSLADACRAGKIEGAVRTPGRGWRATEDAIARWLDERRARRRKPLAPEPEPAPPDDLELLARGRTRSGRGAQ